MVVAAELQWVKSLLSELLSSPPTLFPDNLGATFLSANPVFHSRMKHFAADYHFVHDLVQSSELPVVHVSVDDQLADALTKSLSRPRLFSLCNKISVISSTTILRGRIRVYLGFSSIGFMHLPLYPCIGIYIPHLSQ